MPGPVLIDRALACEAGTVMLESKAGPFLPLTDEEMAPCAPSEQAHNAADYAAFLAGLFRGLG